jgi:multiple sugar transport system substrate-binding protein
MTTYSRRLFLGSTLAALPVLLGACGATATPTVPPQKPAQPAPAGTTAAPAATAPKTVAGGTLAFMGGTYFVGAAQELFTKQLTQWGTENDVKTTADYMNWPDLQAKIAAAIQSGSGADMVELWPVWPFLYKDHLADMTDLAEAQGKAQGGHYDWVTSSVKADGRWLGVPHGTTNAAIGYRISHLKEAGVADPEKGFPDTWAELFALGKKLKAMGRPIGQALGHSLGDPPGLVYPYMWSHGAMEVEADGKTVAFNKPEFVEAMNRFVQGWKDGFDETGLSWDDSNNNRAFLAGQLSITYNGSSIYEAAKKDNPAVAADMSHADIPRGPHGRFYSLGGKSMALMKASKNQDQVRGLMEWWFDPKQFGEWLRLQNTYQLPPTRDWEKDPMWTKDPKLAPFARQAQFGRTQGYAGPPNEKSALVMSKYIVVDTFAKAVQSGDAAAAVNWGADELQRIYGA